MAIILKRDNTSPVGGRKRKAEKDKAVAGGLEAAALDAQRSVRQPPVPPIVTGLPQVPMQQPQPNQPDASRLPSSLDFANAGAGSRLPSLFDFPQGQPPPIPQGLLNPAQPDPSLLPSRFDFANAGPGSRLPSRFDFANAQDPSALIPPITPQNTIGDMIPPITPGNTAGGGGGPAVPASVEPSIQRANEFMQGDAGPWGADLNNQMAVDDPRAVLARTMANDRLNSANYTTSGPGWPGKSSAIFGKKRGGGLF